MGAHSAGEEACVARPSGKAAADSIFRNSRPRQPIKAFVAKVSWFSLRIVEGGNSMSFFRSAFWKITFELLTLASFTTAAPACTERCPPGTTKRADGGCYRAQQSTSAAGQTGADVSEAASSASVEPSTTGNMTNPARTSSGQRMGGASGAGAISVNAATPGAMSSLNRGASAGAKAPSPSGSTMGPCAAAGTEPTMEVCDGADNDCDGMIDEALRQACGSSMQGNCRMGEQS